MICRSDFGHFGHFGGVSAQAQSREDLGFGHFGHFGHAAKHGGTMELYSSALGVPFQAGAPARKYVIQNSAQSAQSAQTVHSLGSLLGILKKKMPKMPKGPEAARMRRAFITTLPSEACRDVR